MLKLIPWSMSMLLVGYSISLNFMALNLGLHYYQWDAVVVSTVAVVASLIGVALFALTVLHELKPEYYKAITEDVP